MEKKTAQQRNKHSTLPEQLNPAEVSFGYVK